MRQALIVASALVIVAPNIALAKEANRILSIDVDKHGTERVVRIRTQSVPTFTVFRLTDPMRVVVDISGGDVGKVDPVSVDDGVLEQIGIRQFAADGFSIARVIVGFAGSMPYDVRADGNAVLVSTGQGGSNSVARIPAAPSAPDNRAMAAELENQRKEAEHAAQQAATERKAAQVAAQQAEKLSAEAERISREANRAKAEAETLRAQVEKSTTADKARAEDAARAAELRTRSAEDALQKVTQQRALAERAAAEAERKKRDAEEAAAMADAKHKKNLADLAAERATAAKEKSAAQEAQKLAAQAKREAETAQRAAVDAQKAAEKTRTETAKKLGEMGEREQALAEAQKRLEVERRALSQKTEAVERERQKLQAASIKSADLVTPKAKSRPAVASLSHVPSSGAKGYQLSTVKTSVLGKETRVALKMDGVPQYEVERLNNPPRLVVDLMATKPASKRSTYSTKGSLVTKVRLGEHGNNLRAVFDLASENVTHHVADGSGGLTVSFKSGASQSSSAQSDMRSASASSETPPASLDPTERGIHDATEDSATATLRDVRFTAQGNKARIVIDVSANTTALVDDRSQKSWVLQLRDTTVAKALERSLDASAYGTSVRLISTYQASVSPPIVNVVASLSGPATSKLNQDGDTLVWEIEGEAVREPLASSATVTAAGFASRANTLAQATPKQTQRRVNMRLKDADLVNVIRFIADVTGENIIVAEDVKGKVTVNLRNVPWEQALDMILKTRGYDKVRQNNILRIATLEQIQREKEAEIARKKAQAEVEDTLVRIIAINYAIAKEISEQLKPSLSPRGSIQVDDRTNTIIAEDLRDNLERIIELTKRLDRQTPQVLIEARIVEAASNYQQELGIQWGGTGQATGNTGNPTGLSFPGDVALSGAADPGVTTGTGSPGRYAVNLPAPIGATFGSGIGFIFGSASGNQLLNLRLTALESNGSGRIISSPRVTTLDNKTAKIAQGVDIPISVVSAQGVNTRFIPANLELEVTPHVTNDGSVLLKIKTAKNEPDFQRVGGQGDPTIVKKFAETEVMVRDGDTAVIGGIYTRNTAERYNEVPLLSKIPILGWLFKNRRQTDDRAELLVFITPRIVNRDESMLVSDASMSIDPNEASQGE